MDELNEALVVPRRAFVPLPDTQVIERDGWLQLLTPSMVGGMLNEVCASVLHERDAEQVIVDTQDMYQRAGVRYRWRVGPGERPLDLGARLERAGLQREDGSALVHSIVSAPVELPRGVTIEAVSEANVDDFTSVMAEGWGMQPQPLDVYHRRVLSQAPGRMLLSLLRLNSEPAAAAAVALFPNSAYLMGAVVLPELRGRGLYRALVAHREQQAARLGRRLATTHARARTSMPVLLKLGFREVCALSTYYSPLPRSAES